VEAKLKRVLFPKAWKDFVDCIFNLSMLLISILARLVPECARPAAAPAAQQAG
jgi:hypothetical protein